MTLCALYSYTVRVRLESSLVTTDNVILTDNVIAFITVNVIQAVM